MQFGLVLPIQSAQDDLSTLFDQLRAEVAAAERAGFDAVFLPEFHQARGGALISPLLLGAALLAGTERIRFGPAVLATPLHHPVRLAEDAVMVDHITRGRLILGLGIGHLEADFAAYGVQHDQRAALTEEALEILDKCFAGDAFSHRGRFHQLDAHITPGPYTRPRPPIWMGAHAPAGLDRAARYADRWLVDPQRDVHVAAELAATYRRRAAAHGRTPRVGMFREAWIGDSKQDCERTWAEHVMAVHRLYYNVGVYHEEFEPWVHDVRDRAEFTLDVLAPGRFLYGSGEDIRATLTEWTERTGSDYYALRLRHPGGPTHEQTLAAIARFGDEVIASYRGSSTSDDGGHRSGAGNVDS